jgi:hypothetical protein
MSTAGALCIKNTSIDQIGLGHLISKHKISVLRKQHLKHLNFCFNILYFEKQFKLYGLNLVCTKVVNNTIEG